jgi:1,4-dihydroxy-2-naphthoyl-CoA synthase
MTESDLREVQKRELAALEICYKSVEHKEAINAFIEKRDPDFREARKR